MGYDLYARGNLRGAYTYFKKVAHDLPDLEDHVLFYLGATTQGLGLNEEAAAIFSQLIDEQTQSVHYVEALRRLAEINLVLKEYNESLRNVDDVPNLGRRRGGSSDWAFFMKGRIALARGQREKGQDLLAKLWIDNPGGLYDDELPTIIREYHLAFSDDDMARRAKGLLKLSQGHVALQIYSALLKDKVLGPLEWEEGRLLAWIRIGEFNEAWARLNEIRNRRVPDDWGDRLKIIAVKILIRQNHFSEASALLAEGRQKFRQGTAVRRKLAFLKMDAGLYAEGARAFEGLISQGGRSDRSGAIWMAGWGYYQVGQLDRAARLFEKGLKYSRGYGERGRLLYWRGRILEKLGNHNEANDIFCQVIRDTGWSYYSFKSIDRLEHSTAKEHHCEDVMASIRPAKRDPHKVSEQESVHLPELSGYHGRRLALLLQLGLKPLAAQEIHDTAREIWGDREGLTTLAALSQELDEYTLPLRLSSFGYQIGIPGRTPQSTDQRAWRFGFPLAYPNDINQCRHQWAVDPNIIWSLMRQESHFQPGVISSSNAIGLMQLIPPTAKKMASHAKLSHFKMRELTDPSQNIRLGCRYVAELSAEFSGEIAYIAAAYNAGEAAAERWLIRRRSMPVEEFVEEIPFAETNDYVKKVMTNYWTYRRLR